MPTSLAKNINAGRYSLRPCLNIRACGRELMSVLSALLIAAGVAGAGDPPAVKPNSSARPQPAVSLVKYTHANDGAMPATDSPIPLTTAPPPMMEGPTAFDSSCGSLGRADFFPFEFNRYTIRADGIWLRRDPNGDQLLANGVITATGQAFALDTESAYDVDTYVPGVRIFAEEAVGDCTSFVNASFFWLQKMNVGTTLDNTQGVVITRGAGGFGFSATTRQDTIYDSILYGAEVNYREDFGHFSLFIGPRFLHLEETLSIFERGVFDDFFRGQVQADGTRRTFTYNDMIGGQVGADYHLELGRFVTFTGFGKAALMANFSGYRIDQGVSDSANFGPIVRSVRANRTNIGGIFETGVFANVRLTRNVSFRGGYQLLYLVGMAIAPDQFIPDLFGQDTSDVDRKGTAFYHGPFAGLEVRWGLCE